MYRDSCCHVHLVDVGFLLIAVDTRHLPMCMSGAAVLKQSPIYFSRTESCSLVQTSSSDMFKAKLSDEAQVLLNVVFSVLALHNPSCCSCCAGCIYCIHKSWAAGSFI